MLLGWSRDGREQATGQMAEACGCICSGDGVCKELTAGPLATAPAMFPSALYSMTHLQISWRGRGREGGGRGAVRSNGNPRPRETKSLTMAVSCMEESQFPNL